MRGTGSYKYKVKPPKTNTKRKTHTMYHMQTLGASKCMHVVHSSTKRMHVVHSVGFAFGVGLGWFYLTLN